MEKRDKVSHMQRSAIASIRVPPELRAAADNALEEGESLSRFAEQSLRLHTAGRQQACYQ
mgnify:CR=1 FL=1